MALYKRSIFVINPNFQYKFSAMICFIVFLSSLIYPWTIFDIYEKVIALKPESALQFEESRQSLLLLLALIQIGFLGIVFVVSIFMSHKIAGPLYKLQQYLKSIRERGQVGSLSFRKGDNFPEIAEEVNLLLEDMTQQREEDFAYLSEVSSYVSNLALVVPEDKKPVLNEILSKLSEIQNRYQHK